MKEPLYITLNNHKIDKTMEIEKSDYTVNLDYDKKGFLCGIEILHYKKLEINGEEIETNELVLK